MSITELTTIIKIADRKKIVKRLCEIGYIDCKQHKELQNLSIETLFKGELEETETFSDVKDKLTYQGGIFTKVDGYEWLEFIIVNINDHKNTFPIDMLIWAKEI